MSEWSPSKEDVLKIAKAITDSEHFSRYNNYSADYECVFCSESYWEAHKIKHSNDCPVLAAQDILTGIDD